MRTPLLRRSGSIDRRLMDRQEFARRRRQFMRMIGKDAIAVLPAAPVRHRNGDIEYAYRQDSQFYYLSGFPEPDAVLVLVPGRAQAEYLLFVREHDPLRSHAGSFLLTMVSRAEFRDARTLSPANESGRTRFLPHNKM